MVDDKIHARGRGPVQILTRQPTEEIEGWWLSEDGARLHHLARRCAFLKERLMDQPDRYCIHACETCGLIAVANLKNQTFECCKNPASGQGCAGMMPYTCSSSSRARVHGCRAQAGDLREMMTCSMPRGSLDVWPNQAPRKATSPRRLVG